MDGRLDPTAQLWPLNFTYQEPAVLATVPPTLPAGGGAITVIGTNFGGDSSYIFVLVYGVGLLRVVVELEKHAAGNASLQVPPPPLPS
ncbi:hypothetical protein T484DRAFT_1866547 [Baffinella frigidus]|nr:hypothetical protein T484DRAFT_1866547 [Cryptophyta sp. CCMP2293]